MSVLRETLEKMQDYPLVLIEKIEILPVPEVIDYWSEEAAKRQMDRPTIISAGGPDAPLALEGINRTPEVAFAFESQAVQTYLQNLKGYEGLEVNPDELAPHLEADGYFKWAHRIPGTQMYMSLSEAEPEKGTGICQLVFHGKGPNFGSAGGPTLRPFGPVAAIHYEGRLVGREAGG